jgi:thiosulfate/3-mercaptopyruvate sulfurtransferase
MAGYGIGRPEPCTVVAYDDQGGMSAARLVVMLRMLDVSATLLDGGLQAWIAAGQPLTAGEAVTSQLAHFQPSPWPTPMLATADDVRNAPHDTVLLDGRSPERFRGDGAAAGLDPRPGHVPGARNAPWSAVLRSDHDDLPRLKSPRELAEHYRTLGVAATDDGPDVVAYCGSGISACMNVLAMQHAGFRAPRLFVASWSGWASDSNNPAELGDPTA